MVRIHLSKLLGEKRMTQKRLSELTGIRPNTIKECEALGCSVEELIEYTPNKVLKTGRHLIIEEHGNRKKGKEDVT